MKKKREKKEEKKLRSSGGNEIEAVEICTLVCIIVDFRAMGYRK